MNDTIKYLILVIIVALFLTGCSFEPQNNPYIVLSSETAAFTTTAEETAEIAVSSEAVHLESTQYDPDIVLSDTPSAETHASATATKETAETTISPETTCLESTQSMSTEKTDPDETVETYTSGFYSWKYNNNGITIVKYNGDELRVEIPSEIDGYPVTIIGEMAFLTNTTVESIIISDSVNEIQSGAFLSCIRLSEIVLPEAVTTIPYDCFGNCLSLKSLTLPQNVTEIGKWAFDCCRELNTVYSMGKITKIGDEAFRDCGKLVSVENISEECDISDNAFDYCRRIDSVQYDDFYCRIRDNGIEIADYIGDDENVIIPDTINGLPVISVGKYAFNVNIDEDPRFDRMCNILHITLPGTVIYLEEGAFCQCPRVESVDMPKELQTIGDRCFESAGYLKKLDIPKGVTTIGERAFYNCRSLKSISFSAGIKYLPYRSLASLALDELVLPETLEEIDTAAFATTSVSSSVYFPDSVKYIAEDAFSFFTDISIYVNDTECYAYKYAVTHQIPVVIPSQVN